MSLAGNATYFLPSVSVKDTNPNGRGVMSYQVASAGWTLKSALSVVTALVLARLAPVRSVKVITGWAGVKVTVACGEANLVRR